MKVLKCCSHRRTNVTYKLVEIRRATGYEPKVRRVTESEWVGTHRFDGIRDQVTAGEPDAEFVNPSNMWPTGLNRLTSSASLPPVSAMDVSTEHAIV